MVKLIPTSLQTRLINSLDNDILDSQLREESQLKKSGPKNYE